MRLGVSRMRVYESAGAGRAVPVAGGWVVAFCAFLFGYTTLIGWSYYGEVCLEYIFGRWVVAPYRWVYCALIVLGAISKVNLVWAWGDLMNGLQIFPNLVGVVGLNHPPILGKLLVLSILF